MFRRMALAMGCLLAANHAIATANFESGPVRPLIMSSDSEQLYAANTPGNSLEVFDVAPDGSLHHAYTVPVGLEPVAIAVHNDYIWVVNHMSDSVSVIDALATPPRVIKTLLVGDEPNDIVFAGPGFSRAFVTTARRGQNNPIDPQYFSTDTGRANVWVFDANNLGSAPG